MSFRKFVKATCLAIAGVTMFTGAAMAFSATSNTALNVRSGPSTGYRVVDTLYTGERVNVERCNSSRNWCYITHTGPDGWVSANYLTRSSSGGGGSSSGGTTSVDYAATATVALNIRSGPSTNYRVVDALYTGERVNVERCSGSGGWCYVTHRGPDGWVASKYLRRAGGGGSNTGDNDNNDPNFSIQFGSDGEFSFSIGNRPAPDEDDKACFYSQANYNGRSFCLDKGEGVSLLQGGWNDAISSVRVYGDVKVTACKHADFNGYCNSTDNSVPRIGTRLNNEISSLQVR